MNEMTTVHYFVLSSLASERVLITVETCVDRLAYDYGPGTDLPGFLLCFL